MFKNLVGGTNNGLLLGLLLASLLLLGLFVGALASADAGAVAQAIGGFIGGIIGAAGAVLSVFLISNQQSRAADRQWESNKKRMIHNCIIEMSMINGACAHIQRHAIECQKAIRAGNLNFSLSTMGRNLQFDPPVMLPNAAEHLSITPPGGLIIMAIYEMRRVNSIAYQITNSNTPYDTNLLLDQFGWLLGAVNLVKQHTNSYINRHIERHPDEMSLD